MCINCYQLVITLFPADGIALGAAATTSQTHVEMIVFVAIMLHKVEFNLCKSSHFTLKSLPVCHKYHPPSHLAHVRFLFAGTRSFWPGIFSPT